MTASVMLIADSGWDNHMADWGAGWWILMAAMMVVFWGLIIVGAVWLIRSLAGADDGHHARDPLEVLDHRLARGEISVEEYRQRRDLLEKRDRSGSP